MALTSHSLLLVSGKTAHSLEGPLQRLTVADQPIATAHDAENGPGHAGTMAFLSGTEIRFSPDGLWIPTKIGCSSTGKSTS
jgi:hypothetical protein